MGSKCCADDRKRNSTLHTAGPQHASTLEEKKDLIAGKGHKDKCEDFDAAPDGAKKVESW